MQVSIHYFAMPEEPYLANPPGACCLKGVIHDGEPQGSIVTVAGVETYIARPAEGKVNGNIVLYFPDIFGLGKNARLLIDGFACAGYLVLALDYFRGVGYPLNENAIRILLELIFSGRYLKPHGREP